MADSTKRIISEGQTFNENKRARNYSNSNGDLSLRVVVKDVNYSDGAIRENIPILINLLTEQLTIAVNAGKCLKFEGIGEYREMLRICCADYKTLEWLTETVESLKPWQGASLEVCEISKLHRLTKATMRVPGEIQEPQVILTNLNGQNEELCTKKWSIFNQMKEPKGQLIILGIDDDSIKVLEKLRFKPYLNLSRVFISISRKEKEMCQKFNSYNPNNDHDYY